KIRLAHLRAEVAERRGPDVALVVGRGDGRRALEADVAVGRSLALHAHAHPARGADEARLARLTAGHEAERAARRVGVPDWHRERAALAVGDAHHRDVRVGEERLAL